jgi:hypothetical protein
MNLGILLWNQCNIKCAHCAVDSGPRERPVMDDTQILRSIDAAFHDDDHPSIGFSGGEVLMHPDRLCGFLSYASSRGARTSITTNAFWARTVEGAVEVIRRLMAAGLNRMVVSTDQFHQEFIPEIRAVNAILACKRLHLEVELQWVSARGRRRLAQFLAEHGDAVLNINCREIPCHPVGRAACIPEADLLLQPGLPDGKCPAAVISIAADGRVIPCCNTAGHLPTLQVGRVDQDLVELDGRNQRDPVMVVLRLFGPKRLAEAAVTRGAYHSREAGYVDQCHLCYDLFKNPKTARICRDAAVDVLTEEIAARIVAFQTEASVASTTPPQPFPSLSSLPLV